MIFQNFQEKRKGSWYHKTFEECREIRKIKILMWTVWLFTCSWAFFHHWWHEKNKVQVPQWNEMLSLYYTALDFICKNEEYKLKNNAQTHNECV